MPSNTRHRRILKLQSTIAAAMMAFVLVFTGGRAGLQQLDSGRVQDQTELVQEQSDFWKVVAGEQAPNGSGVTTKFAVDLREAVGQPNASATELPSAVSEFKAGPNAYGGIKDALGLNPFNNAGRGCEVCGTLSAEMKADLLLVKQDKLDVLIKSQQAALPQDTGIDVTPFDGVMGALFWAGVYAVGTTSALIIAVRRDGKKSAYRPNMVRWQSEGGSVDDPYRRLSKLLSPLYVYVVVPLSRRFDKTKDLGELLKMTNLSEVDRDIRTVEQKLKRLPLSQSNSREAQQLRDLLERLKRELDGVVHDYDEGFSTEPLRVVHGEADLDQLRRQLESSSDTLMAHRQAREEIGISPSSREQSGGESRPAAG